MAKDETEDQQNDNADKKSGSSTMKIIIIVVALIVIIGGGGIGGTLYFLGAMDDEKTVASSDGEAEETKPSGPPQYLSMDPKFIVSFDNQSKARFMQFSLEVMTRNTEIIEQIETHMPVIRSSLLMLLGGQGYEEMITREGKEKFLSEVTTDINSSLQKLSGKTELVTAVEAAYFTNFVIQ